MEVLRKSFVVFVLFVIWGTNLFAQNDNKVLLDAFSKSYEYEKKGDYTNAIEVLKKVYDENSYEMNLRLGWLSYSKGVFSQSIAYYNRAISIMPYAIEPKLGIIYPLYATGKTELVINKYKEILKIAPDYIKALYNLGNIYYGQGRYTEALEMFKKIVDLFPFDHDALLMYAWSSYQLRRYKEATVLFSKVLLANPGDKSALQGLELIKK